MTKVITLKAHQGQWWAAFEVVKEGGREPDREVTRLFDTHVLPTPFLTATTYETVKREVQQRNPEAVVF